MATYVGEGAIEMEPVETDCIGSLAQLVVSELPGCTDLMARQKLGYALREFCRETDACVVKCRHRGCDGIETRNGRRWFEVVGVPCGTIVQTILNAKVNGREVSFDVVDGPVQRVLVDWVVDDSDAVEISYSVCPKAGGEYCPKWFKDRYAEAITAGAMYHLLSMTGKAWSDVQRAGQYLATYQEFISDAAYRRAVGAATAGGSMNAIPVGGLFM